MWDMYFERDYPYFIEKKDDGHWYAFGRDGAQETIFGTHKIKNLDLNPIEELIKVAKIDSDDYRRDSVTNEVSKIYFYDSTMRYPIGWQNYETKLTKKISRLREEYKRKVTVITGIII